MDLNAFSKDVRQLLIDGIPVESDENFLKKHKKRGKKLFQAFSEDANGQVIPLGTNGYVFELGSTNLEANFPHYHILEDAYTIKKRGKGTATSKGSQATIVNKGQRDYGGWIVTTGKGRGQHSVYQEYRKNVRGGRKPKEKYKQVVQKYVDDNGEVHKSVVFQNVSTSYVNRHYHYIEKTMDNGLPFVAQKYGLRMARVQTSDEEKQSALQDLYL